MILNDAQRSELARLNDACQEATRLADQGDFNQIGAVRELAEFLQAVGLQDEAKELHSIVGEMVLASVTQKARRKMFR